MESTETQKNTYHKFAPNVYLAKCFEQHEKGDIILVETKYGKENESVVHNFIGKNKEGFYFYSITRADGLNAQEYAKKKIDKLESIKQNALKKSETYYEAAQEGREFLSLGEPIKVGHHSEKRHRALIDRNWDRMGKCVEFQKKADSYEDKKGYWESRKDKINLSMPEILDYYRHLLEEATRKHEGLKNGTIKKEHSFDLTYAKRRINKINKEIEIAEKLWG